MNGFRERSAAICTLGCRVNQYESQAIAEELERHGVKIVKDEGEASVYILNTCTVTAESDRKARQLLRRLRHHHPDSRVLVTGCLAQRCPDELLKLGADFVSGSRSKLEIVRAALRFLDGEQPDDRRSVLPPETLPFEDMRISRFGRTRAYLKIEDGCDGHCAYCVIPSVRGNVVSKPRADVLREAEEIVRRGCREIVLTGIETSAYQDGLEELIASLGALDGLDRIRLGSLDPSYMKPERVRRLSQVEKLMPHFHLSMQAGSDRILRAMRRKYNVSMAKANFEAIRTYFPHANLTTDIMTGFPGETDEDFADTMSLAESVRFLHIHIFTYSRRPGTEAAKLPDLDERVKIDRAASLGRLQAGIKAALLEEEVQASRPAEVLFETFDREKGICVGHSRNFEEWRVSSQTDLRNTAHIVVPTSQDGEQIEGKLLPAE